MKLFAFPADKALAMGNCGYLLRVGMPNCLLEQMRGKNWVDGGNNDAAIKGDRGKRTRIRHPTNGQETGGVHLRTTGVLLIPDPLTSAF